MKRYLMWGLLVVTAMVLSVNTTGFAAKGKATKGKPKAAVAEKEAAWESIGVFAKEDFDDEDDFDTIAELGDVFLRNYQRFSDTNEVVLTSKKKLQIEPLTADGKDYLAVYAQEQLGRVQISKKAIDKKVEAFRADLKNIKPEDKAFDLYAENDKNAPARCYAAGTRVLFPPYNIRSWNQCVNWAQGTGVCRQVEMPSHYPELSTDGCKCFY